MTALNAKTAETLGAKRWMGKTGEVRFYFNDLAALYGLKIRCFKTGNVSDAWLDGEEISNSRARKIITACAMGKVWLGQDGELRGQYWPENTRYFQVISEEIRSRAAALAPKKITSELNRRAWAIRRAAAAQAGVKIMDVSWKICLEMAREI